MKAVVMSGFGGPEVLSVSEVEDPEPGYGEVLVRIVSTSVNRLDLLIRRGHPEYRVKLPHVLGTDVSGVVEKVGPKVESLTEGDRVVANPVIGDWTCEYCAKGLETMCGARRFIGYTMWGSYAEYIKLPERALIRVPKGLDLVELGSVPQAMFTAWRALKTLARVSPGERVLIWGGSGGIGTFGVQIAKMLGGEVIATTGTEWKEARLKALGADHVVNHHDPKVAERILEATGGEGADVVLNPIGGGTLEKSIDVSRQGARIVFLGVIGGLTMNFPIRKAYLKNLHLIGTLLSNKGEAIEALKAVASGAVKPVIHKTYSLEEVPQAHETMERGEHFGKLLVKVAE